MTKATLSHDRCDGCRLSAARALAIAGRQNGGNRRIRVKHFGQDRTRHTTNTGCPKRIGPLGPIRPIRVFPTSSRGSWI